MTVPLVKQLAEQAPEVQCHVGSTVLNTNMMLNRTKPPFDDAKLREAVMLTLDRKAFVDILTEGAALRGGSMLARPAGVWGLPTRSEERREGTGVSVRVGSGGRSRSRKKNTRTR